MKRRKLKKGRKSSQRRKVPAGPREDYDEVPVPRSFVIHNGHISSNLRFLIRDFKRVMMPNTADKLVAQKRNSLKDFLSFSSTLKVTHFMIFSQTETGLYLKICRTPGGPTITFRIDNYSLTKDVLSSQVKQLVNNKHTLHAPCLMTNLQPSEGEQHLQLCSKMFLDMFPTIAPSRVKTREILRCCLIHYDEEEDSFDFRHYAIKLRPVGICKSTRKIINSKIPNLSSYKDVSDFVMKTEGFSESEAEDDSKTAIERDTKKKGQIVKQQSTVKLFEMGPSLSLKLVKIETGIQSGTVLYHSYITRTAKEKLKIMKKREEQLELKRKRQKEQNRNLKLKETKKESHRQRCLKGMGLLDEKKKRKRNDEADVNVEDVDDDAQYYRDEVGQEPEEDLFKKKPKDSGTRDYRRYSKKKEKY